MMLAETVRMALDNCEFSLINGLWVVSFDSYFKLLLLVLSFNKMHFVDSKTYGMHAWDCMQLKSGMTIFGYKSFENVSRKQSVCEGCWVRVCVPSLFVWMEAASIVSLWKKEKKKEKQYLRKQWGRCGSRQLPGIVKGTDEGGGWGKVRTLLNRFTNERKPLSLPRWQGWGQANSDFLHHGQSVSVHQQATVVTSQWQRPVYYSSAHD